MSSRGPPLQRIHATLPSVHVVQRFSEIPAYYRPMVHDHGHSMDFQRTSRIPYQTCIPQPLPLAHLDNVNTVVPACQLFSALPGHPLSAPRYPIPSCQPCAVGATSPPVMSQSMGNINQEQSTQFEQHQQQTFHQRSIPFSLPHSPPPPTRKTTMRKRRRSFEESDDALESKYPRNSPLQKIEFRPLAPVSSRKQGSSSFSRLSRGVLNKRSNHSGVVTQMISPGITLRDTQPYKFEFNIPLPPKPKEMVGSNANMFNSQPNEISEEYKKTWPTKSVPKEGYINVLEQAINDLSERCLKDKDTPKNPSNKENVAVENGKNNSVTKESLDKAWLHVLNKVFGKSKETRHREERQISSQSETSGYPSECYSEVEWTSSTLESDSCISGTEHENGKYNLDRKGGNELNELLPRNFQLPYDRKQTNEELKEYVVSSIDEFASENYDKVVGDHDYSKPHITDFEDNAYIHSTYNFETETIECPDNRNIARGYKGIGDYGTLPSPVNEDEDDESDDDYDIIDEHEEEKATDADVETEFMSSAEHEAPRWGFLKPRLLRRSPSKKIIKSHKQGRSDETSETRKGFVTPTYQCNFPTSSDSEAAQGISTPSQTRKPQPPFKSPEPVDPTFRGVTLQIRTKVEKDQVQLSIKGFFK